MQPGQLRPPREAEADAAEFAAVFDQCAPLVLRFAWRRLGEENAAWDVVSDTFTTAWRNWSRRPATEVVLPWLYAIAGRAVADQVRAGRRRQRLAARLAGASRDAQVPDPADEVALRESIAVAMDSLSDTDQEVLRLVGWEHLDDAEALGTALGVRPATARVRVHRARQRLRAALHECPGSQESMTSAVVRARAGEA
jgi:RNA polymerase sigma factor (sigma-70 family)